VSDGRLFSPADSEAGSLAETMAWLWRLGPVLTSPDARAVGVGGPAEAADLRRLVDAGRLAGAVVLAGSAPGPAADGVPARVATPGLARFPGARVRGRMATFADGAAVVRSSVGVHAVRDGRVLAVAFDAEDWGRLPSYWALPAIASHLAEVLDRPLVSLPAVGCLRVDDVPGSAEQQLLRRDKPDSRQRRWIRALARQAERSGARVVVGVPARALRDGRFVGLDEVWPRAVAALRDAVRAGLFEPACHGLSHVDEVALARGEVSAREFALLDAEEAGRRMDEATAWLTSRVGAPASFIAPAWSYGEGTLRAAEARGLPVWLPPAPGPLLEPAGVRETLRAGLQGLHGVDYRALERLAESGLPPVVVLHGRLLDDRLAHRDVLALARLALRRDLARLMRLRGVRWVGTEELVGLLRAHDATAVREGDLRLPTGGEAVLMDARGRRAVRASAP
jgi:peptidoglycan/xylan/chitin deacetylase (PgdA/CDA1 family)